MRGLLNQITSEVLKIKMENYTLLTGESIKSRSKQYTTSLIFNSLIHGGRTYNEQWRDFYKENTVDIDIVSCYGGTLADFYYPLGIPRVYEVANTKNCITLRKFLETYKKILVDNLYTITISGDLSFSQSLLYSKIIDAKNIKRKIENDTTDSNFVILEKQLMNTLITSDILDTLTKICSTKELKEIYDCKVITAVYYSKDDFIESQEEWLDHMEKDYQTKKDNLFYIDNKKQIKIDNRTKKWCRIKLDGLINPLIQSRQQIKSQLKNDPDLTEQKRLELQGLQGMIKLIINTFYGIISSKYFDIGNTILANNVTAKARVGVWLASRALNGIQCITDGCQYQPGAILKLKNQAKKFHKPGLKELSNLHQLKNHRYVEVVSLNNIDWNTIFETKGDQLNILNQLATEHIAQFLNVYNLKPYYQMEHKENHTSYKLFTFKKAHYISRNLQGETIFKVRGANQSNDNPYYQIALSLFEKKELALSTLSYQTRKTNAISDYQNSGKGVRTNNKNEDVIILIPGYSRQTITTLKLTNEDLPYRTYKEYKTRPVIDYAPLLLQGYSFQEVVQLRIDDYDNNYQTTTKSYSEPLRTPRVAIITN